MAKKKSPRKGDFRIELIEAIDRLSKKHDIDLQEGVIWSLMTLTECVSHMACPHEALAIVYDALKHYEQHQVTENTAEREEVRPRRARKKKS